MSVAQRMNTHWTRVKQVAALLSIDKMVVHRCWSKLKQEFHDSELAYYAPLWEAVIAKNDKAIECARKILHDPQPRLFVPFGDKEKAGGKNIVEAVKLACWYLEKIGDLETAEIAFNSALSAIRKVQSREAKR